VLGPAAAPITRLKRDYRYHFILKSPSRERMNALLRAMLVEAAARKIPRTQVIVDVDAVVVDVGVSLVACRWSFAGCKRCQRTSLGEHWQDYLRCSR